MRIEPTHKKEGEIEMLKAMYILFAVIAVVLWQAWK